MLQLNLRPLLKRLNPQLAKALESASGLCVARSHYEVSIEHVILKVAEDPVGDIQEILRHYEVEPADMLKALQHAVDKLKTGNPGKPVFSPLLVDLMQEAWLLASVELGCAELRSGALFLALVMNASRTNLEDYTDAFEQINAEDLRRNFSDIVTGTSEDVMPMAVAGGAPGAAAGAPGAGRAIAAGRDPESALGRFTVDFTAEARAGKIDPIFERDTEIRQMINILARRRKNNPIIVGEAGVGKTALAEGLALRIVEGDVPDFIKGADLLALDMGLLQAGAGMKGEFETRLKNVLSEVKASPKPIILFIDEAHTLIGAGDSAGGSDAANLLKPALARGELRTVAATTWSEYKKYFERDPALTRRFQVVKCDEPSVESAVIMMRGLRAKYEETHGVRIPDSAVVAAAKLSNRYISGRLLPDKSVDLLDTAAARVRVSLSAKPDSLDDAERRIVTVEREIKSLERDRANGKTIDEEHVGELNQEVEDLKVKASEITELWMKEKEIADRIQEIQAKIESAKNGGRAKAKTEAAPEKEKADTEGEEEGEGEEKEEAKTEEAPPKPPSKKELAALKKELHEKLEELVEAQGKNPLVHIDVNPDIISKVVADWTGIPVGNMVRDEVASILSLADRLRERIIGQDYALDEIAEGVRAAKSGLSNPDTPMGVFLLVGPSGVGKTETALAVADELFGGERFMTSINMSEFQEAHTVSRLVGSPPGYVGYGEGGVLTEAVRKRPYSVVLLDESEKCHLDVMNIFYQVFDKGVLADGEGRIIDFKNTVVFLTSNLATDEIMQVTQAKPDISGKDLMTAIRPVLSKHFKPALLARMTVIPFFPLIGEPMAKIVVLKLNRLGKRLMGTHKMGFSYEDSVVKAIADRCTEVETGARNIDHIMNGSLLPMVSTAILEHMSEGTLPDHLNLDMNEDGAFKLNFSTDGQAVASDATSDADAPTAEDAPEEKAHAEEKPSIHEQSTLTEGIPEVKETASPDEQATVLEGIPQVEEKPSPDEQATILEGIPPVEEKPEPDKED